MRRFTDGPLAAAWGVKPAARFWHIATTGHDGEAALPFESGLPTEMTLRRLGRVPGSPECVRNAYDASQVLAWLACQPRGHAERVKRMQDIPALMATQVKCRIERSSRLIVPEGTRGKTAAGRDAACGAKIATLGLL